MKSRSKRISILSLPEVQDLYSVPIFSTDDREYFFTLTEAELKHVNRLNLYRNRIHLILMLGYIKAKKVCLIYRWNDIFKDFQYVANRYFPKANMKGFSAHPLLR